MAHTVSEIVNGYLNYLESKEKKYFWAWEDANERCRNINKGLEVTLKLLESAPTKFQRECIAAHVLEDLISYNGMGAINEVKRLVVNSKPLRSVLHVINVDENTPEFDEWEKILELYK